jgi:flagellar export protein FliJ
LEAVLRHRETLEQNEKDELFRRLYRFQTEQGRRNELNARLTETVKELSLKRSANVDHNELNWHYLYIDRLSHEIKQSEKRLAELDKQVQAQKEAVIEATKKRKTISSLRSKREKEFIFEVERQEQKDIDDLVVTRYAAKGLEASGTRKH